MPPSRLLPRLACIACALCVAGCGNTEADALTRARERLAGADAATARAELKNLVQAMPKSGDARLLAGVRLLADGEAAAAAAELERALEFGASPTQTIPPLAEALLQSGQASRVLLNHAQTELGDPVAQAWLLASVAQARLLSGQAAQARATVERAESMAVAQPRVRLARARLAAQDDDVPTALASIDAALAIDPALAEGWMLKGDLLARSADGRPAARQAYAEAVKRRPDLVAPRLALMALLVAQDDLDGARAQLDDLRRTAPGNLNTVMAEGQLAFVAGEHAHAREVFQSLLRVLPDNLPLLMTAGENEMLLGAPQQAEAHFAKASALAPRNPTARRLLARAQLRLGQVPKALATLEPLVGAPDAPAEVLALAAEASRLNGDARQAQALFDRLAALKPTDPRLRTLVAVGSFGRHDDLQVLATLREIAATDTGTAADLALIDAHLSRGQHEAALKALDGLQRKLPDDPMPLRLRGQVLASLHRNLPARQAFDAALALRPGDATTTSALAALDLRDGQPERARERLTALQKAQPRNPVALLAMADLQARQGTPAATVRTLIDAAIKAAPGDLPARLALIQHHLRHGDTEAALNAALAADATIPDSLEVLALLARCQTRLGQTSQALASYGRIISLAPKSPQGHLGTAEVNLAAGQPDQAQRSIQRALELAPGLAAARTLAVRAFMARQQPERAIEIARQMQAEMPGEAAGFVLEGEVLLRQQQWAAAAVVLRKALDKAGPGPASALLYLALAQGPRPADAEHFGAQRLAAHPRDTALLFALAEAAQQRSDLAAAQKFYERVLAVQPEHVAALNNLAIVHLARQQAGAMALAQKAAALGPTQTAVLDTLAQVQALEGNLGEAINTQRRATSLSPDSPELRFSLVLLLLQNNERAEARRELQRLSELGSRFARHAEVQALIQATAPAMPRSP